MGAIAVRDAASVCFHAKRVGIFESEPSGRCRAGGVEDNEKMMLFGQTDGVVEPFEVIATFRRLHAAPGESSKANDREMSGFHHADICFPSRRGPLFGVPVGAHENRVVAAELCGDGTIVLRARVQLEKPKDGR